MRLPEHLELLVTDEPVLDLYSYGPWRVPDGLFEEIRARLDKLVSDPRFSDLTTDEHSLLTAPAPLVVADLLLTVDFLSGSAAINSGTHARLQHLIFGRYHREPRDPLRARTDWGVTGGGFRPLEWLEDIPDKDLALTLARESLDVLEGLEPLEARRAALARLYDDPPPELEIKATQEDRDRWAAHAPDDVLAALPELAGPIGYLDWVCSGLLPVHEHLLEVAPHDEPVLDLLVNLLLQGGLDQVPAELSVALDQDRYGELLERFAARRDGFEAQPWFVKARAWLSRALGAGAADACRAWLDMSMRFTGTVQGLPGEPRVPEPEWIPVGEFQADLRRLCTPRRRVVNPLAADMGKAPQPRTRRRRAPEAGSELVGQPDVVAALAEIPDGTKPVRLLLVGPDGTGKRDAAQEIARLLQERLITAPPLWLADDFFAGKEVSAATTHLYNDARESAGARLMVIDGLDDMSQDPRSGEAIVEELHRALDVHEDLHVVALCEPGGDERIREINPGLALRFTVVHTHGFTADGYAELFDRALHQRGARAHKRALAAAGELLVRTPPVRNLRNARLAHRLADVVVADVRERTEPGAELVVKRADVPGAFDTAGTAGDPMAELAALTGLRSVKQEIELLIAGTRAAGLRRDAGLPAATPSRHMVFTGNPGTGKTEVARLLARIYKDLGVLSSGHLVEASRAQLVGQYIGETSVKARAVVQRAVGGVLFIDEAYSLTHSELSEDYGPEAIAELVKMMEDHREDLVVIVAGYEREMQRFIASDPGLASRFPTTVRFPDFTDDELLTIFDGQAARVGLAPDPAARDKITGLLRRAPRGRSFGNARLMRNLCERAIALQARRITSKKKTTPGELTALLPDDVPDTLSGVTRAVPVTDPLTTLDGLIGLREVKQEVHRLVAEARGTELRRAAGQPVTAPTRHMVFTGNPGTAKTTVARLIAAVYAQLGLLSSGHLVEVDRAALVGPYLGQTAPKVQAAVEQALGGVLFIDEAYALTGDAYGQEAVAALARLMEEYRGDLLVIAAGYEREMAGFLTANSGLESRFAKRLAFPDYADGELVAIFAHLAAADGFTLAPDLTGALRALLATAPRGASFGNGRLMRNLLDAAIAAQAQRLTSGDRPANDEVVTLRAADLPSTAPGTADRHGFYL
ncbi:AAA family ATPase [Actinomadura xylanilytica]|uniref:AAA family ATPase n=1 Tax=Actinomadura xylanilytica TaxID=887459 RepID=UPI00255B2209|nr:AAA family ATPase [Actinomadura xylanilytica]MDL4772590.1 AAA family ATPase [Actinomadura xylanilytica]